MHGATAPSKKKVMRPFSSTPILSQLLSRKAHWFAWPSGAMLFFPTLVPLWLSIPVFVIAVALWLWFALGFPGHDRFVGQLEALHGELPWFGADATTWLRPDQEPELRDALAQTGIVMHELDGSAIRSAADLAALLESRFGKRRWPSEPVAKAIAILERLEAKNADTHAILWRDSEVFARHDAAAHNRFTAQWATAMATRTPHVLLFLSQARPDEPPPEPSAPAVTQREAWWRARPGELTS